MLCSIPLNKDLTCHWLELKLFCAIRNILGLQFGKLIDNDR